MKAKKILSLFVALAMLFSMGGFSAFAAEDITISTVAELIAFRDAVNAGTTYEGTTVTLTADLNLSSEANWTPIGTGTRSGSGYTGNSFKGTFDGGDKTITGLSITSTTAEKAAIGLFGVVDGGTVKNLKLDNVTINVENSDLAGGAIGLMVNNATADNITVSGNIVGRDGVGGIVGRMTIVGTISNCTNNATMTSTYTYGGIGGIVGKAYYDNAEKTDLFCKIINCTNNGTITANGYIGGIVGLARAHVSDCVNNGEVKGGNQTGGIVGQLMSAGTVSGNENKAKISGTTHVGGIIGDYTQSSDYHYFNVVIENNINRGELAATEQCAAIMGCNNVDGFTAMKATGNVSYYNVDGLELFGNPEDMVIDDTNKFGIAPVAKIGDVEYETLAEAVKNVKENDTITLLSDAELSFPTNPMYNFVNAKEIDLAGHTMTIKEGNLRFSTCTIKNGNIIVDATGDYSGNGVFYMFDEKVLTLDNVKLTAEKVNGYSIFCMEGNSNLNLQNGTEVIVKDCTLYGIVAAVSNGENIIENSKIIGNNITGRGFLNGNYTVKGNSEITLTGVTKDGFYIGAGDTLNVQDTAKVDITLNADGDDRYGINLNGETAIYNKAATATVIATDNKPVVTYVAKIGDVEYETIEKALEAAKSGDELVLLADIEGDITVPAGVIFNGNGFTVSGGIKADGDITFAGITKAMDFDVNYTDTTVNIGSGATLELTGPDRMVIGHGCTFNIEGNISDAKTANVADLTPSLIAPGASFTGAGVNFNVKDAYLKFTDYCSSSKTASDTFDFDIENSIWEQVGTKLAFESQSVNATVNFNLIESVLNTGSHLIFGVSRGEVVIDNSNVNVGTSRQIENQSTMTIKNGSVVNGAVATSSNAKNPGTIIVENATYAVTGQFSGSDLGTGTLIIRKGATVSVGSVIDNANLVIDANGMTAEETINFTGDLSNFAGTMEVINNDALGAKIVDGKIVLIKKPVAKIGDVEYATLEEAFKAATDGCTIEILSDVTIDYKWDCRDYATNGSHSQFKESVTINGNNHIIKFTGAINDNNWNTVFRFEENATVKNLTVDISEATGVQRVITAKKSLNVDKLTILGSAKYGIIFGEGAAAEDLANTEISITNSKLNGTRRAISDNEGAKDVKSVTVTGNTLNADVCLSAFESITFNNNTATGYVDIRSYTEGNTLNVTATENTLAANSDSKYNYIEAGGTVNAQDDFVLPATGTLSEAYTSATGYWGECGGNAKESFEFKLYNDNTYMGYTSLNDVGDIIDGSVYVSWSIKLDAASNTDEYWDMAWEIAPTVAMQPNRVEQWVDGVKVAECAIQPNWSDSIFPVVAAVTDADGKILSYVNNREDATLANAFANGGNITLLRDVSDSLTAIENVTLNGNNVTLTNTYTGDYVDFNNVTVGSGVTLNIADVFSSGSDSDNIIEGTLNVSGVYYHSNDAKTIIQNGGNVTTSGMTVMRYNTNADSGIYIYGDNNDDTVEFTCNGDSIGAYSGTFYAKDAVINTNMLWLDYKKNSSEESDSYAQINAQFVNSKLNVASELRLYKDASLTLEGAAVTAGKVQIRQDATPVVTMDSTSSVKATAVENLSGASINAVLGEDGTVTFKKLVAKIGDVEYATLEAALDAAEASEATEITVELLSDIELTGSPLYKYYKKYHFITNVEGGVTVTFNHDNWVDFANGSIGENVTFKADYFLLNGRSLVVKGNIVTNYLYTCWGAKTTIEESAVVNARGGSEATVQVKGSDTVMTVKGTLNCGVINVWEGTAKLIVSGANAKLDTYWFDCWSGTPSALIENGATMIVDHVDGLTETMSVSRGGTITVDNANLKTNTLSLGHDGTAGVVNITGASTFEGNIKLTTAASTVTGPEGLNVTTTVEGYEISYSNGTYGAKEITAPVETPFKDGPLFIANLDDETVNGVEYHPVYIATSIDSLNYKKVGFDYVFKILDENGNVTFEAPYTTETKDVYNSISDSTKTYTVKDIGGKGKYLFMNKVLFDERYYNNDNTSVSITPYAIDLDGNKLTGWTIEMTNEYFRSLQSGDNKVDMFKEAN